VELGAEKDPVVHNRLPLDKVEVVQRVIDEQRSQRAVLVFAVGVPYGWVKAIPGVKDVSETTKDELANLDTKDNDGKFPCIVTQEGEGIRGLNYRSPKNQLGLCMIILTPFTHDRLRTQGLKRVGRFTD